MTTQPSTQPSTQHSSRRCSCSTTSLPSPAGEIVVARVTGTIDDAALPQVASTLAEALDRRPTDLIVDLAGVTACSEPGLGLLVRLRHDADATGTDYAWSCVPTHVRLTALLWPADDLPPCHATVGNGVLSAMARQNRRRERRHLVAPTGTGPTARATLRPAPDPDRLARTDDETLAGQARAGDADAYRELVRRHRTRMFRSALHVLGDSPDPDDLTDDLATHLHTALAVFTRADPTRGTVAPKQR